jgi:UDP-2,3-diacylglucosamine pyrophosphatase LpxH
MLVVLSDLHFNDGSATAENVPARAFALFLDHVLDLAEHAGARKLTLLFLGDIFDLLRTEYWFYPGPGLPLGPPHTAGGADPFPLRDRPWGSTPMSPACEERALAIARLIVEKNGDQLEILRGQGLHKLTDVTLANRVAQRLVKLQAPGAASTPLLIERLYLPGNHDRLARLVPAVMSQFLTALGARPAPESPPGAVSPGAGVTARHGHEHDSWNFEPLDLGTAFPPAAADYHRTPIGDPITTECLARLPYEVRARLLSSGIPTPVVTQVYQHLQGIEDVRPLSGAVRWLAGVGRAGIWRGAPRRSEILRTIESVAGDLVPRLMDLDFTRAWARRRLFRPGFGNVLLLKLAAVASRVLPLRWAAGLLGLRDRLSGLLGTTDPNAKAAARELAGRTNYVAFGHTHTFRHIPLRVAGARDQVYLNSGTWRPRVYEALDRSGFVHAKDMTYLVFYEATEVPVSSRAGSYYEAWNGVMLRR